MFFYFKYYTDLEQNKHIQLEHYGDKWRHNISMIKQMLLMNECNCGEFSLCVNETTIKQDNLFQLKNLNLIYIQSKERNNIYNNPHILANVTINKLNNLLLFSVMTQAGSGYTHHSEVLREMKDYELQYNNTINYNV
jgi:predicted metal-dependent peptidase